jgi:hypothetical protein
MEPRSILRTIIAALVGIGIIVLFIVLMVKIFSHHGGSTAASTVNLGSYSTVSSSATLLIDDPTNVDQSHRQIRITVSNTLNEIDIIQGYQGNVISSQTYSSNENAYASFLQSLKVLNFTKGNAKSAADYRGYCPTGERYVYTFNDGQKDLFSYWSTSCNQGTFGASNPRQVRLLFINQIPSIDFSKMTMGLALG